jgi:hypothetical protein
MSDTHTAFVNTVKPCKCLQKITKALEAKHTRICVSIPLQRGMRIRAVVDTNLTPDAPRGSKPITLIASYCPFCGQEYKDTCDIS